MWNNPSVLASYFVYMFKKHHIVKLHSLYTDYSGMKVSGPVRFQYLRECGLWCAGWDRGGVGTLYDLRVLTAKLKYNYTLADFMQVREQMGEDLFNRLLKDPLYA